MKYDVIMFGKSVTVYQEIESESESESESIKQIDSKCLSGLEPFVVHNRYSMKCLETDRKNLFAGKLAEIKDAASAIEIAVGYRLQFNIAFEPDLLEESNWQETTPTKLVNTLDRMFLDITMDPDSEITMDQELLLTKDSSGIYLHTFYRHTWSLDKDNPGKTYLVKVYIRPAD